MQLHIHISTNTPRLHTSQHQPTEEQHATKDLNQKLIKKKLKHRINTHKKLANRDQ